MEKERKNYLDYLRIISALAVVFIHVVGAYLDTYSFETPEHYFLTVFDSIIRWSVPVFVMISGTVMLRKDYPYEIIVKKVIRIVIIFVFWSLLYAGYAYLDGQRLKRVFEIAVKGEVHLWYLPLTAGLYLMIPIFKKIVSDKKLTEYVLIIGFVINFALPTLIVIVKLIKPMSFIGQTFFELIDMYNLSIITAYPIYFLMGKYIDDYGLPWKKSVTALLCIFGFVASIVGNVLAIKTLNQELLFSGNSTLFVFLQSLGIFIIAKNRMNKDNNQKFINIISANTFGIYLIHFVFTKILGKFVIHTNIVLFIVYILTSGIVIYTISLLISALLKRIPILKNLV